MLTRIAWIICLGCAVAGLGSCQRGGASAAPEAVPVQPGASLELALMSFNIRYENDGDRDSRAWRERVVGAVRMIRAKKPDVIGVQEALHGQAADLRASLPDYEFVGSGRDDGRREGEYAGIFYRRDRFKADSTDAGQFWLSDTPGVPGSRTWGNEIPRIASWVRLVDLASGRGFYVFNSHWDHRHQGSRERAAILIAEKIDGRRRPDEPVALIGDFNAIEENPAVGYLAGSRVKLAGEERTWKNSLVDSFHALHPHVRNRRTLHLWRDNLTGMVKIDHILVPKEARILEAEIVSGANPMISDHYPVMSRIILPPS